MDVIIEVLFKVLVVCFVRVFVDKKIKIFFYNFDYFNNKYFFFWVRVFYGVDFLFVFGCYFDWYNSSVSEVE